MKSASRNRWIRLTILGLLLAGALQVLRWSRTNDPRFYLFLQSRSGRILSRIFHWRPPADRPIPEHKPADSLTAAEKRTREKMIEELLERQPRYRLLTSDGKELLGWIAESNRQYVVFEEKYGESGTFRLRVPATRIKRIEELPRKIPEITYRDIRFQMEFPGMKFYKKPPYSILTDESYFHVERSVRTLQELRREFMNYFRPLIPRRHGPLPTLQVLFFSDEEKFRNYQKRYCRILEQTAGFYSPALQRLVIYNEQRSGWRQDREQDLPKGITDQGLRRPEAARRKRQVERAILYQAEEKTFTTLRHEGAHQLFFAYGIHSRFRVENDWLIEGLAVFMETRPAGRKDPHRVRLLQSAAAEGDLIPLNRLVGFRHARGFLAMGDSSRVELAYCQSWALVYYLMSAPERRNGFFEYVRYIREPRHLREVLKTPRLALLARFLQTTAQDLASTYQAFIKQL